MKKIVVLFLLLVAACGRPLTPPEIAYLKALQGDQIDTKAIRLNDGHFAGSYVYTIPVRPRTTCQEKIWPPITVERTVEVSPAATVIFNTVLLRKDVYSADFMAGFPEYVDLVQAMLFAHEATHVWQWQNRDRTGYHPLKALREHTSQADPYLFDTDTNTKFLDFGYEQQGSIVEEYVCCRLLDPEAPRTGRLRDLIAQEMPVARLDEMFGSPRVRVPWAEADFANICR